MRVARSFVRAASAMVFASGLSFGAASKPTTARRKDPGPRYAAYVSRWHTPDAQGHVARDDSGRAKLVLVSLNTGERAELAAASELGGFAASDLDRAARVLRDLTNGNAHPVEPRLVDLVYRVQVRFQAQEIRVVSGYRTPRGRTASNHGRGRAMDFVVPGATDADVATFARQLGFVGVGIYPSSGFVHLDVRDRSYFWIDASAPGHRNRERGILRELAVKSDAAAAARGERPLPMFAIGGDVETARSVRQASPPPAHGSEDDDAED